MRFPRDVVLVGNCIEPVVKTQRNSNPRKHYLGFPWKGEKWLAHRLSYHLNTKRISRRPKNRKTGLVLHHCDNKWCINPEHLYLGSAEQNAKDNATRNIEWRRKRSERQKEIGFPPVTEDGRRRMAEANRKRLKGKKRPELSGDNHWKKRRVDNSRNIV